MASPFFRSVLVGSLGAVAAIVFLLHGFGGSLPAQTVTPQLPPGLLPSTALRYTITPEGLSDFPRDQPDLFLPGEEKTYRLTVKSMMGMSTSIRAIMARRSQGLTFVPEGSSASCSFSQLGAVVLCDAQLAGAQEISFFVRFRASCPNLTDYWPRPQVWSPLTMPAFSNAIPSPMIACPQDNTGDRVCGDGINAGMLGEECDDGNTKNGDGCASSCNIEYSWKCAAGSPSVCTYDPFCGNSVINAGEECDDSNSANGDGCSVSCAVERGWKCEGTHCLLADCSRTASRCFYVGEQVPTSSVNSRSFVSFSISIDPVIDPLIVCCSPQSSQCRQQSETSCPTGQISYSTMQLCQSACGVSNPIERTIWCCDWNTKKVTPSVLGTRTRLENTDTGLCKFANEVLLMHRQTQAQALAICSRLP